MGNFGWLLFTVFPEEEVLTRVQVTGLRHSIMTCQVTCTAVQRGKVSFLCWNYEVKWFGLWQGYH